MKKLGFRNWREMCEDREQGRAALEEKKVHDEM